MATAGATEFVTWDDIDLDVILGDYTDHEEDGFTVKYRCDGGKKLILSFSVLLKKTKICSMII